MATLAIGLPVSFNVCTETWSDRDTAVSVLKVLAHEEAVRRIEAIGLNGSFECGAWMRPVVEVGEIIETPSQLIKGGFDVSADFTMRLILTLNQGVGQ